MCVCERVRKSACVRESKSVRMCEREQRVCVCVRESKGVCDRGNGSGCV